MLAPVQEIWDGLESRRERLLAELRPLAEEQLAYRPRSGAWSLQEVAQHVMLTERVTVEAMVRHRGKRSGRRRFRQRIGYALVWAVLRLGLRARNPVRMVAPERDVKLAEVEREWLEVRRELRGFLAGLGEEGMRQAALKHPIAGPLDVREALDFLMLHFDHHLRQVKRIFGARGFPAR